MFSEVDGRFGIIKDIFINNNSDVELVQKAYNFAKNAHKSQLRKDGLPYISHPVEVALILAELGFDENVVSAALLHDVVEDCAVTLDDLKTMFNEEVAELVDCVSAIDKTKYVFNDDDLFEDSEFRKASIEEQSFKKLISIGKKNPAGFCIKFADRLHNLRTIESFDYNKQLEKVKETEKWIIPIAKILNANFFYQEIKNECFKIIYKNQSENFLYQYNAYHNCNQHNVNNLLKELNETFYQSKIRSIRCEAIKEYKVYEDIINQSKRVKIEKISQGQILKVSNYNIYILYDGEKFIELVNYILEVLDKKHQNKISVINADQDNIINKPYFVLEDKYKNKYNMYIETVDEYVKHQTGVLTEMADFIDDDNLDSLDSDIIKVKTRSGEVKYVQKDSTVLDFAFKIHRDIGLGFKYAIINDSKTKVPPYTKLMENDKIEIVTEKMRNGTIKNVAELKWFAYVNTIYAKKCLIRYFEKSQVLKSKK